MVSGQCVNLAIQGIEPAFKRTDTTFERTDTTIERTDSFFQGTDPVLDIAKPSFNPVQSNVDGVEPFAEYAPKENPQGQNGGKLRCGGGDYFKTH